MWLCSTVHWPCFQDATDCNVRSVKLEKKIGVWKGCMCCISDCSFVFLTSYSWSFNNMTHNSTQHRDALRKLQVYVASPLFLCNVGWSQAEIGHIVSNKSTQATLVAIAVGRVNEHKLACSPDGNFNAKFNKLEKVKFSFIPVTLHIWMTGTDCWVV